ncbi:MAG: OmpA family protein [Candidatus Kapaibacteriota bacterium]
MKKMLLFIFATFTSFSLLAQNNKPVFPLNYGPWGAFHLNFVNSQLKWYTTTDGQVGSINESKLGSGFGFGGIINYPITNNIFITGRLGYNYFSSKLNFYLFDYNTLTYTTTEDVFDLKLSYLEVTPGILFYPQLVGAENLYFLGGFEIGPYLTKTLTNTINGNKAEITQAKTRFALTVGLGYTFQIDENVYLSPEISYRFPFTKVYEQDYPDLFDQLGNVVAWHKEQLSTPQIRIGVNLTFSIPEYKEVPKIPAPAGEVGFKQVLALDNQGNFVPATLIRVEDTRYQEYFPIVPYVFFESNSSSLAKNTQYLASKTEAGAFDPQNLPMDALEINKRTLDIVGWRLKNNPRADLTVTGTTDGTTLEKNNKQLPLERANFVKDYLVNNWGVNPQRINTRTSQLPSKPSTSAVPEGVEENRRAELSSSNPEILAPILIESENQRIADPQLIQFVPYANVSDSISFWEIDVYQGGNLLKRYNGSGYPQTLHWTIKPNELSASNVPIDYSLVVETVNGKKFTAKGSIPTEYLSQTKKKAEERPDVTITKFSLVLFDFDKAEVSQADRDIINKLIIPNIKFNSTVKIYGYTDRIGDDEYNLKLALRRAETVKNIIQAQRKNVQIETYGVGERQLLFDNDIPTGRHLSRTVQVVIVTPK